MISKTVDPYGYPYGTVDKSHPCLYNVKSLNEYLYIRVVRNALRLVSGWPGKELGEKLTICEGKYHAYYNTGLSICFFIMQMWYIIENAAKVTFFELGHMYISLLMNIVSTSRGFTLCTSAKYRALAVNFLTKMHVFFHKDNSDYARKVYVQVHRVTHYFSAYLCSILLIALILFNMVPPFVNYTKGRFETLQNPVNASYELSIYFKLPINPEKSFRDYCYSFVLNWYASTLCACSIIMFDLFLSIMIFNLVGHFKILLHTIDTFPIPSAVANGDKSVSHYSPSEQVEVSEKLKDSILYHRLIVDFTNEMSEVFGLVLFVYYTFHQISGCLLLLECSQGNPDALARYLPLTIMMFAQLIQISIIFEMIGTMSEKLKDAAYCLPWEYMNIKNRRSVLIFLINVQEPIHVKAGGLVDVGVTTMASILKASFSYFAFLRTMSD